MELFTNNYTNHDVVGVIVFSSIMICVAAFMTGLTIYVYRSVPDPVNDIEHGVVHLTDTGHSWNRPLSPLRFAPMDQPGLYGNVGNAGNAIANDINVGDSNSSQFTSVAADSIPSVVEATFFPPTPVNKLLVVLLTCSLVAGIIIAISLFTPCLCLYVPSHAGLTSDTDTCSYPWIGVKDCCLVLLVKYSLASPTKILILRVILRLIFSWLAH